MTEHESTTVPDASGGSAGSCIQRWNGYQWITLPGCSYCVSPCIPPPGDHPPSGYYVGQTVTFACISPSEPFGADPLVQRTLAEPGAGSDATEGCPPMSVSPPRHPPISRFNLIYHVFANAANDVWLRNVRQLRRRFGIFNGPRLWQLPRGLASYIPTTCRLPSPGRAWSTLSSPTMRRSATRLRSRRCWPPCDRRTLMRRPSTRTPRGLPTARKIPRRSSIGETRCTPACWTIFPSCKKDCESSRPWAPASRSTPACELFPRRSPGRTGILPGRSSGSDTTGSSTIVAIPSSPTTITAWRPGWVVSLGRRRRAASCNPARKRTTSGRPTNAAFGRTPSRTRCRRHLVRAPASPW